MCIILADMSDIGKNSANAINFLLAPDIIYPEITTLTKSHIDFLKRSNI